MTNKASFETAKSLLSSLLAQVAILRTEDVDAAASLLFNETGWTYDELCDEDFKREFANAS